MRVRAAALLGLVIAACVVCWLVLAPTALGGATSYLTTHGDSMEPRFHAGDVAALQSAEEYRVGDIVGYRSERLDTMVMHRIVDIKDSRYVLQGDNNDFTDPDQPTRGQILGRLLFRIPQGGVWLDRLTSPTALGLLAFVLLTTGGTAARSPRRRRGRPMSQHAVRSHKAHPSMAGLPHWAKSAAVAAAVSGVLGISLGALAWSTPTTAPVVGAAADPAQSMTFDYSAVVPESAAYDDTTVTAPEPIFRKLTDNVEVAYSYRGEPGTVTVAAELSTASGWHSTVPLAAPHTFTTNKHSDTVSLDLDALERHAQAAAEATGIPTGQVDVTVVPTVVSSDEETFAGELAFTLTPLQLLLADDPSTLAVGAPADAGPAAPSSPGTASLSLAGRDVAVPTARMLALLLTAGALLAAALVTAVARMSAPATEAAAIHRRYGQMLVRVQPMPAPAGRPLIDLVDFATLAKLAERYDLLILHWSRSDVETFVVQDQGTTYRYRTGAGVVRTSTGRTPAVL